MERRTTEAVAAVTFTPTRASRNTVLYSRVEGATDTMDIALDVKPKLPAGFDPTEGFEHCAICGIVYPTGWLTRVKGKWYCGRKGHNCVRDTEAK